MNNYSETNYYFYRTAISFTKKDTLVLENKTLLSYTKETIPLMEFSSESNIIQKKLSRLARCLLYLELVAIIGFFVALVRIPILSYLISIPMSVIVICMLGLASIFYYVSETKSRIYFYFHNGRPAFKFSYRKDDPYQKQWTEEFASAVKNAQLNFDQDNIVKIEKGIASLVMQNLISKQFADILRNRVNELAITNINKK